MSHPTWEDWPARIMRALPTMTDDQAVVALKEAGFSTRAWFVARVRERFGLARPVEPPTCPVVAPAPSKAAPAPSTPSNPVKVVIEAADTDEAAGAVLGVSAKDAGRLRRGFRLRPGRERRGRVAVEIRRDPERTDLEIARVLRSRGDRVATCTVAAVRARLGLPPRPHEPRQRAYRELLGTMTDRELAAVSGRSPSTIQRERTMAGIAPYRRHADVLADAGISEASARKLLETWKAENPGIANMLREFGVMLDRADGAAPRATVDGEPARRVLDGATFAARYDPPRLVGGPGDGAAPRATIDDERTNRGETGDDIP